MDGPVIPQTTYQKSLKGIFLFGGVQIYKILLSIIRAKCTAVFLGPSGYGIYGLISSTLATIEMVTGFGLGTSSVKNIAQAEENPERLSRVASILKRLIWWSGLLGMALCLVFSSSLSRWAFGTSDYTLAFVITSVTLLFQQLVSGQGALLCGLKKYKAIARLNLAGNFAGLLITIPLYYFWQVDAIIPVIVLTSLASLFFSTYYTRKIKFVPVKITRTEMVREGKDMLRMGIYISMGYALMTLAGYLVRIFISHSGGTAEVGLFIAGFSLVNTYIGMIFSSIEKDYYPRLSSAANQEADFQTTIRQQVEVILLTIAPAIILFIAFAPPLISLFYSSKFIPVEGLICWTALAMFFKAPAWALSISFLSKGDTKAFSINQFTFIAYQTALNVLFYRYLGLTGLGFSFLLAQIIYLVQTTLTCKRRYQYAQTRQINAMIFGLGLLLTGCCMIALTLPPTVRYISGTLLSVGICIYCIRELNRRTDFLRAISKKLKR